MSGNQNVKIRTLDSSVLNIGTLGFARDYDLAVAMQDSIQGGLEVMQQVDKNVSIGDDVLVLGNSQGSGVVTEISGKVTGIGPELVEVDAKFVAGNSGSPIIHVKTGKVIAIATFAVIRKLDTLGKDSQFTEIRRFGYRLDTVPKWEFRQWDGFQKEGDTVAEVERKSESLIILLRDIFDDGIVNARLHQDGNAALSRCVSEYLQSLDAPPPRMPTPKLVNISDIENRFSGEPLPNESGEEFLARRAKLAGQGALGPATLARDEDERQRFQEQAERRRAQLTREAARQAEVDARRNAEEEDQRARTNFALARQNAKVRFLRNLADEARSDIRSLNLDNFTDFHAKKLRNEIEFRAMVEKELKKLSTIQDTARVITFQ